MNTPFLGAILDPRSDVEKAQDYRHEEIAGVSAPITFPEKAPSEWRFFSTRNQAGSSSCMAQSGVKALGVENTLLNKPYIDLSALPVYRARSNYSGQGMFQQNLFDILCSAYACKESDVPSQGMTEEAMNAFNGILTPAETADAISFKGTKYVFMPYDINEVASMISQGHAVHLMFFFNDQEWWKPIPTIIDTTLTKDSPTAERHGLAAIDFIMNEDKRCLIIEDSAGNDNSIGGKGQRIITEDFFLARCFGAGYIIKIADTGIQKPQYKFIASLVFGEMNNPDVIALQNILKYENFFPQSIPSTGNMLQITCGALQKWQIAHGINDFAGVTDVRLVHFGPKSIALANQLYA